MNKVTPYTCLIFFLIVSQFSYTQELSYIHYNTNDGLAGATTYDICQDIDGFIWIGTETGLSRFDGKNFKNYTVNDGLPDNEILKVFADSKGRVWIIPFKRTICYYFKNKIYTSENDRVLKKISTEYYFNDICEDENQNIILADTKQVILIRPDNSVINLYNAKNVNGKLENVVARKNYFEKGFVVRINDTIFYYKDSTLVFHNIDKEILDPRIISLISYKNGSKYLLKLPVTYIRYDNENNYVKFINTPDGVYTTDTINKKLGDHYLAGKKISKTIEDKENNLWFCTLDDGIYKLSSKEIRTINFNEKGEKNNTEVYSIDKSNDEIICGLGFSKVAFITNGKIRKIQNFSDYTLKSENSRVTNRLYSIKTLSSGITMLGFDSYLIKLGNDIPTIKEIYPVKCIEEIDSENILVGTSRNVFKIRIEDLAIVDTVWTGRSLKVYTHNGSTYIGTLNGLYEINYRNEIKNLGTVYPGLAGRIMDIKSDTDSTLYVATADRGITIIQRNHVIRELNELNGLSSNVCRTIFLYDYNLFVGTNKGLNKINLREKNSSLVKYTIADGLPSDIINGIYVNNDSIWLATPAGLTFFNDNNISSDNICKSVLLSIKVSGIEQNELTDLELPYRENNIAFEYAGISFKSGGEIEYFYKLDGLDDKWNKTRQTNLTYESLPPGNYTFQLYTINKFGLKSNFINVEFRILRPFWMSPWLYAFLLLGAIGMTAWIVNERNRKFQKVRNEQYKTQLQMITLEQKALQAQMNPHFIFNCLNSIQQYILINDKEKANQFLSEFATLVRQTLDISDKRSIFLSNEIDYLKRYLQMEKMRFADNFDFSIQLESNFDPEAIEIPPLLHQPFVENCLRHGIRYKENGTGFVSISFQLDNNILISSILDNGVGRQAANSFKSKQHIEYQSKGIKLTEKRIELINKVSEIPITFEIFDLQNEKGKISGTGVKVKIPIKNND